VRARKITRLPKPGVTPGGHIFRFGGMLLALVLGCRERVRIHTEEPIVRETTCQCTRWETQPYLRRVCYDRYGHPFNGCDYVPDTHRVAVDGTQRCEVTTMRYSWRYADEPSTVEARIDEERRERGLEACR
jgi:hypothetical protein